MCARAGIAIIFSLALASVFVLLTWLTKDIPAFDLRQPWQDDPFDVLVSLDYVLIPVLVGAGLLRMQLCRKGAPLPARRLADLLRLCLVVLAVVAVTELGEWAATMLGLHRAQWNTDTSWQIAALVVLSIAVVAASALVATVTRDVRLKTRAGVQPDWLADAVELGVRWSRFLTVRGRDLHVLVRWVDATVFSRVRKHPAGAAGLLACIFAVPFVASKILLEGYPPLLILLSFALPAAVLFGFTVLAGRFLRIIAPTPGPKSIWLPALVAGCITGPMLFAFHDTLLSHPSQLGVDALLFGAGLTGAFIYGTTQLTVRHIRRHYTKR